MKLKKLLGLSILGLSVSLNASLISAITGTDTSIDEIKPRGIIVKQDIDGDGIIDSKDDCLETNPCGKEGCIKTPVVILKDKRTDTIKSIEKTVDLKIYFDVDEYIIKEKFTKKIKDLISFLEKNPAEKIVIEGHTDSDGTKLHNMVLSQNRANAVKEYILNNSKISENRVESQWFGEERPLNNNATEEEKELNRRVIAILDNK